MQEESSSSQNVNLCITSCQRGASRGTYKVFLEDGSSFFISVDFFLTHKLKKGFLVSEEFLSNLREESNFVEAYIKATALLARQVYTVFGIRKKLTSKEFDKAGIERAIEKLIDQGELDDYSYSERWVQSRLRTKLDSYKTLYAGLMNKGISSNIIKEVLKELYSEEIEEDIIKKSIDKCCRQGKNSDKITKALLNKGFSPRKVNRLLEAREIR